MNVTFDRKADALYIKLQAKKRARKTVIVQEGVMVDIDKADNIFGIEILDASHRMPAKALSGLTTNLPVHIR
jgi:uncharacterized protein YuzE